jgi:hypothetical protein
MKTHTLKTLLVMWLAIIGGNGFIDVCKPGNCLKLRKKIKANLPPRRGRRGIAEKYGKMVLPPILPPKGG